MLAKWISEHQVILEVPWLFSWNKWRGFAGIPFIILVEKKELPLIWHEQAHAYQRWNDGFFWFYIKYLWYTYKYGYTDNPYEIKARLYAKGLLNLEETGV